MRILAAIVALSLLGACGQRQQQAQVGSVQAQDAAGLRAKAVAEVDALADELLEHWRATSAQIQLQSNLPVTQIEDLTFDVAQKDAGFSSAALSRLRAIDLSKLPEDRWVLARLLEHTYDQGAHAAEDYWLTFAVTPYSGAMSVLGIQRVFAGQKFATSDDLQRYLGLVDEYAAFIDQNEMGLYSDPYDRYGHLLLQSMLATRLVVDTGMNYFDWPLEQARAYMKEHTFESDVQIASETLRYSTDLFAQALDYRLGYDQFWRLRREVEAKLGERFDIRRFHAAVVGDGAMPLDVLAERVDRFIAGQRGGE